MIFCLLLSVTASNGSPKVCDLLAFTSTRDDSVNKGRFAKARNIFLMDISSGDIARITDGIVDDWYPSLVGKGNELVFVSERDDLRDVRVLKL